MNAMSHKWESTCRSHDIVRGEESGWLSCKGEMHWNVNFKPNNESGNCTFCYTHKDERGGAQHGTGPSWEKLNKRLCRSSDKTITAIWSFTFLPKLESMNRASSHQTHKIMLACLAPYPFCMCSFLKPSSSLLFLTRLLYSWWMVK